MTAAPAAAAVRDATGADLPRITEIYRHYVLHSVATFEETPPDLAEMTRRFRSLAAAGLPWLVAEPDAGVAAYACAAPWRDRAAYRYVVEDSVYVDPGSLRRGLGAALLGALLDRCEASGKRRMIAVIGGSDNVASIRLHGRFGFRHTGLLPGFGYKFGAWADAVLMTRALGAGSATPPGT